MSGQYQERKEYFKQYREKNKERLQLKRHDYYEANKDRIKEYANNGNKTIPQWCACQNKNTLKRTKIKSMNPDAVSVLKIMNK